MITHKFNRYWNTLLGNPTRESLEARIFHAVCLLSVVALLISLAFVYFIDLSSLAAIMLGVAFLVILCYYFSRFKAKTAIAIMVFSVLSNLLFIINFYYNSGVDGPTLLISIFCLFLTIVIAPSKQFFYWISFNILSVLGLLVFQFQYPGLIKNTYTNTFNRHSDLFASYIMIALLVYVITRHMRKSYNEEHQAAAEKTAELAISNNTKDKLLSILAHDLMSPLDSIQSYLELLSATPLTGPEKQYIEKDLLQKTQNTSQMLLNLVSWTRAQMDGVKVEILPLNALHAFESTILLQETIANKKGIRLLNNLDASANFAADRDMMQIVLRNLISNAIKFTPAGGEITISNKTTDDQVIICVQDTGIGMSGDTQNDIFSLKAKSTYGTNKEKGFGLGLVLCKEFIEMQNGQIWYQSEAGKGTTFCIKLKAVQQFVEA